MNKRTKLATAFFIMAGLVLAGGTIASCSLDRILQVPVPQPVQDTLGVGPKVSLREAPHVKEAYVLYARQNLETLDANIEDAYLLHDLISTGVSFGLQQAQGPLSALPGGTALVGGLTTLGALFMRRPGDKSPEDHKAEVDRAYDDGKWDANDALKSHLTNLGVRLADKAIDKALDAAVEKVVRS